MNKTALIAVCIAGTLTPNSVNAECVMRTSSLTKVAGKLDAIADIKPLVSPAFNNERKCSISVRVQYKSLWYTAHGEYTGDPAIGDQELCVNAVEIAARQFLASKEAKLLHSDQQMVCTDEEPIKNRPVQKGEVIRLSEVTPHPTHKNAFEYKGATCRWFVETTVVETELKQWQGVVCKTGRPDSDDWTVVDRF